MIPVDHRQNQNPIITIPTCILKKQNDLFNNVTVCAFYWKTLDVVSIAESGQCLCLFAVSSKAFDCKVFLSFWRFWHVSKTWKLSLRSRVFLFGFTFSISFSRFVYLSICRLSLVIDITNWLETTKKKRFFFRRKHFSANIF